MQSGYDAIEDIKLKATVQAVFRLQKPVTVLVPNIGRLEYDIYNELEVPSTKVYILSMHQAGTTNWTNVVFGILPDPIGSIINPVCLSLVRSSLIDLFLQQSNLTLTPTIFGQPSSFEIMKFHGGITVLPEQTAFISLTTQNYFNFVLNNSVRDIKEHLILFKEEMRSWLRLRQCENVFVQVTNENGSTTEDLVKVKAGVISDEELILPHRSKQLAQRIINTPTSTNLGLNNTVFGKVKEITLSSFLNRTLHCTLLTPSPAPAPAPQKNDDLSPSYPSAPSPFNHSPHRGLIISPSPSPSVNIGPTAPSPESVGLSPSPLALPLISPHSSSFSSVLSANRIWVCFHGLLTFCLLIRWQLQQSICW